VATKDLRTLRHRYKEAYTAYMTCVHALSDASQQGVWPEDNVRLNDQKKFNELAFARMLLLDALAERRAPGSSN
jgi:hypothetical protein